MNLCQRSRDENEVIDRDFFRRRIERAWSVRRMLGFENSCRVVFGESDGLPGLTVDKFADCLSFQIVSLGMERWKDDIVAILAELFQPQGIYERDDVAVREKEGLPQIKECVYGTVPEEIEIREHDARMLFSLYNIGLFAAVTAISFAVFAALYAVVYRQTAGAYYAIVSGGRDE